MVLYLLNTLIVPFMDERAKFEIERVSVEEAKEIVKSAQKVTSAIGHSATAQLMSMLLGMPVQANRIEVYFKPGDQAIALVLKRRLAEGQVIQSEEELRKIGFDLFHIQRVS